MSIPVIRNWIEVFLTSDSVLITPVSRTYLEILQTFLKPELTEIRNPKEYELPKEAERVKDFFYTSDQAYEMYVGKKLVGWLVRW